MGLYLTSYLLLVLLFFTSTSFFAFGGDITAERDASDAWEIGAGIHELANNKFKEYIKDTTSLIDTRFFKVTLDTEWVPPFSSGKKKIVIMLNKLKLHHVAAVISKVKYLFNFGHGTSKYTLTEVYRAIEASGLPIDHLPPVDPMYDRPAIEYKYIVKNTTGTGTGTGTGTTSDKWEFARIARGQGLPFSEENKNILRRFGDPRNAFLLGDAEESYEEPPDGQELETVPIVPEYNGDKTLRQPVSDYDFKIWKMVHTITTVDWDKLLEVIAKGERRNWKMTSVLDEFAPHK